MAMVRPTGCPTSPCIRHSATLVLLLPVLHAFGCSGQFYAESGSLCQRNADCGLDASCELTTGMCTKSAGPCSVLLPDGDCPIGMECNGGVCLCTDASLCACPDGLCPADWCAQCGDEQACVHGVCAEVVASGSNANSCSPDRPAGACPRGGACCGSGSTCCSDGEICVGDHCVPNARQCSVTELRGWCGPGLACLSGRCVPDYNCTCVDGDETGGCCPAGMLCTSGICVEQPCSSAFPGACDADQVCMDECTPLPCAPGHPAGVCASGETCSQIGECIPENTCKVAADCTGARSWCSAAEICLPETDCAVDADCETGLAAQYGQGYECQGRTCVERQSCTLDLDCLPELFCSVGGSCLAPSHCDADADCGEGTFCSATGRCAAAGTCLADADCDPANEQFCASNGQCLGPGQCVTAQDCPPVQQCIASNCVPAGQPCSSNDFTTVGCQDHELRCCEPGKTCCEDVGEHCSTAGNCIPSGECADDGDCLEPYFACQNYGCVPVIPCAECGDDEQCSIVADTAGTWHSGCLPWNRCASASDCYDGEFCNAQHTCEPAPECGFESLDVGSLVPPNVLVVLDRSGSMNICGPGQSQEGPCGFNSGPCTSHDDCEQTIDEICYNPTGEDGAGICIVPACSAGEQGSTTTRWVEAMEAIDNVTDDFEGQVSFGLSLYPLAAEGDDCSAECNWSTCSGGANLQAGAIDVAVGTGTRDAITSALQSTAPGGATPTAPTLREILDRSDRGGLNQPDRANAVMLVTDGEAVGDLETIRTCAPSCDDGSHNGLETDIDCGGLCGRCRVGQQCLTDDDCSTGLCRAALCRASSCANDLHDDFEVAVDCGGDCGSCPEDTPCTIAGICTSGVCTAGRCAAPACNDEVKNGSETGVDCGSRCSPCDEGAACMANADCKSAVCQDGTCRDSSCNDQELSEGESDTDCGGVNCGPCDFEQVCGENGDCQSGSCVGGVCAQQLCNNGIMDLEHGETDVDCGGASCAPCSGARTCATNADCISEQCLDCGDYNADGAQACRVNAVIDQLYALSPRIKTFVVGFAFEEKSANMNCHASHGRTQRTDLAECEALTAETCSEAIATCYYEANDKDSLETAFVDIMDRVAACDYSFPAPGAGPILDPDRLFFYLVDEGTDPPTRTRIHRGIGWDYFPADKQVRVFGVACDRVKLPTVNPLVIRGCPGGGG